MRRRAPRDDILSAPAHAEGGGERLSQREMLNVLRVLLVGGNETTTNLIGNGMLALLANPDQRARRREDPGLLRAAVEELLERFARIELVAGPPRFHDGILLRELESLPLRCGRA